MATPSASLPPERRKRLERLLDQAYKDYVADLENLTDAATDEIETILERSPLDAKDLVREYTATAARLSDEYYRTVRQLWQEVGGVDMPDFDPGDDIDPDRVLWQVQGGFAGTDYNGLTYKQVKAGQARSGATIDDLWPSMGNVDDAQQFIADMIREGARLTTRRNMRLDPTHPKWARVPRGSKTCAFCLMLASRGFAYLSEDTAGREHQYHADCDCDIIPSWGRQKLTGYDPDAYREMWQAGKAAAGDGDWHEALAQMRRIYPDKLKDGVLENSGPWPDDVVRISGKVWDHIFTGHGADAKNPKKSRFPASWSEERIKWIVKETVCDPDFEPDTSPDGFLQRRRKGYEGEVVEVYLKKRRNTHGRWAVQSAYPMTEQQRKRYGI